jgi:hypothetical protein
MSIEAMKQAVEAFEHIKKYVTDDGAMPENWDAYHEKEYFALEALRQAIEQAEYDNLTVKFGERAKEYLEGAKKNWQEPVAYKYTDKTNPLVFYFTTHKDSLPNPDVIETALYTAPNMSTKPEKIDTSAERVHETDKSIHDDDDIQEYKKPWIGLTEKEIDAIGYKYGAGGLDLMDELLAMLKEKNT